MIDDLELFPFNCQFPAMLVGRTAIMPKEPIIIVLSNDNGYIAVFRDSVLAQLTGMNTYPTAELALRAVYDAIEDLHQGALDGVLSSTDLEIYEHFMTLVDVVPC